MNTDSRNFDWRALCVTIGLAALVLVALTGALSIAPDAAVSGEEACPASSGAVAPVSCSEIHAVTADAPLPPVPGASAVDWTLSELGAVAD